MDLYREESFKISDPPCETYLWKQGKSFSKTVFFENFLNNLKMTYHLDHLDLVVQDHGVDGFVGRFSFGLGGS